MNILGLSDGPRPSAALVRDGRLVGLRTDSSATPGLPWRAAERLLHDAELSPDAIDHVAVAGKYSPMLALRRYPALQRLRGAAFSPTRDLHAFAQAFLRQSGLGALESDRATAWWTDELAARGYAPRRVQLVHIHRALGAVGYRCQADDDVLVITLHPMGDGVVASVRRGEAGFVECAWEQRGNSALHVHLTRCAAVLGLSLDTAGHELSALAGRGQADAGVLEELSEWLRAEEGRIVGHRRPLPSFRRDAVYQALGALSREDAAATLLANLRDAICGLVGYHLRLESVTDVVLCGSLIQDPRLVADVARLGRVRSVNTLPFQGAAALAVGAAASLAGLAPRALPVVGLGPTIDDASSRAALVAAELAAVKRRNLAKWVGERLIKGEAVARRTERGGLGPCGLGRGAVLVRADDRERVEHVRRNLGRSVDEEPLVLFTQLPEGAVEHAERMAPAFQRGVVSVLVAGEFAKACGGAVSPDGRVRLARVDAATDPDLHGAIARLEAEGAVAACFPFAAGDSPAVTSAADAVRVFITSRLDALVLGPFGAVG